MSPICHHKIKDQRLGQLVLKEKYVLSNPRKTPVQLTQFSAHFNKESRELTIGAEASVLNLAYDKLTRFVYTTDSWATRHEFIGNYVSHEANRATFGFSSTSVIPEHVADVAISLFVQFIDSDHKEHIDNNCGNNFTFIFPLHERVHEWHSQPLAVVHTSTLNVHSERDTYGVVFGTVSAANWSNEKKVIVRYTHDNWATSDEVEATYCCSIDGRDNFVFEYAVIGERDMGVSTSYCVRYETCGTEFWDGNNGKNFTFASPVTPAIAA